MQKEKHCGRINITLFQLVKPVYLVALIKLRKNLTVSKYFYNILFCIFLKMNYLFIAFYCNIMCLVSIL